MTTSQPLHTRPNVKKMTNDELWLYYSDVTDQYLYALSESKTFPKYLLEIFYFSEFACGQDPYYIGFDSKTHILNFMAEVHFGSSSPLHGRSHLKVIEEGWDLVQTQRQEGDQSVDLEILIEKINQMLIRCSKTRLVPVKDIQCGERIQDRQMRSEIRRNWGTQVHEGPFNIAELERFMPLFY